MSKVYQKVELTANILIILAVLVLAGVFVQRYFFSTTPSANQPPRAQPTIGKKVNLPEVDWMRPAKTLILVLQTSCRFCNDSAPFYKRVIETTRNKNIQIVAVFPSELEKGKAYLNKLGLDGIEVKQSPLDGLQVSGTPTVILANNQGEITDYWVGKLSADKEDELLNKL